MRVLAQHTPDLLRGVRGHILPSMLERSLPIRSLNADSSLSSTLILLRRELGKHVLAGI
jgi:hypothetical protein